MRLSLSLLPPGISWNVSGILTCLRLIPSCRTVIPSLALLHDSHQTCFAPFFYQWNLKSQPSPSGVRNFDIIIFMLSSVAFLSGVHRALALSTISSIGYGNLISQIYATRSIPRRDLRKSLIKKAKRLHPWTR